MSFLRIAYTGAMRLSDRPTFPYQMDFGEYETYYSHMVVKNDVNKMMAKLMAWSSAAEEGGEFHITCEL